MKDTQELPAVLNVEEVRKILRLARPLVYQLVHRKDFPAMRFGRAIRIPRDAFLAWLEQQTQGSNGGR